MYTRRLNLPSLLEKKSLLLLGPRQTGKSTVISQQLKPDLYVNLAERDTFRNYSARPELLRQQLLPGQRLLVIDEAQLLPELFDEAQVILDRNSQVRILLTGSSARKLRRGGVNLLPGRIWQRHFHPLISAELETPRVAERLVKGGLPGILDSPHYREDLLNYVGLYLDQEIRAEGLTRSIGNFSRFLSIAALTNAEQLNFTKVANDAQVKLNTVRGYYEILIDTLIGFQLPPFRATPSRKAAATPKFYFFDTGVVNAMLNRFEVHPGTEAYGKMLEQLIFVELRAFLDYNGCADELYYWRTLSNIEVDFLIDRRVAIEVKATVHATSQDEKPLLLLAEDLTLERRIIVCSEPIPRKTEAGTEIMPVEYFMQQLWGGEVI